MRFLLSHLNINKMNMSDIGQISIDSIPNLITFLKNVR